MVYICIQLLFAKFSHCSISFPFSPQPWVVSTEGIIVFSWKMTNFYKPQVLIYLGNNNIRRVVMVKCETIEQTCKEWPALCRRKNMLWSPPPIWKMKPFNVQSFSVFQPTDPRSKRGAVTAYIRNWSSAPYLYLLNKSNDNRQGYLSLTVIYNGSQ